MRHLTPSILALLATTALAQAAPRPTHHYIDIALSPDGTTIASVEGNETQSGEVDIKTLVIRDTKAGATKPVTLPCGPVPQCTPSSLAWAPDSKTLAFALRTPGSHAHSIYTIGASGGTATEKTHFNGTIVRLRYSPKGTLAALATEDAKKEVGAVEAAAPIEGELGSDIHEQRIAIVGPSGALTFASPPNLFVYEYDWRPDESGFVGTAAPGDGDNNWWIAKLYSFDATTAAAKVIYTPTSPSQQIAVPRISPDGKSVTFIAGIMSDFGSTGGDAYLLPLDQPNAQPIDLTPKRPTTITALSWSCDGKSLLASELASDQRRLITLGLTPKAPVTTLTSGQESLGSWFSEDPISISCATSTAANVHSSFTSPPEIEIGPIGKMHDLTSVNAGLTAPATVKNVTWKNQGFNEQGWLLIPTTPLANGAKLAMITDVHGGPAAANEPSFVGSGYGRRLLESGYAIFLPNPRGSYGQGEAYTRANIRDFGYGDLRDILAGVTAAEKLAPIDEKRLGLTGWSYGGFMTMWAVTQTHRFAAAVAGAGLSNWQSYYGENGIDAWMIPYFGASVYDDPKIYAKSSPINFIKNVKTPTLTVVGAADIECPAPQTQEFWHALNDLGVPTSSVIYPGEGHWMHNPKHVEDFENRMLAWFAKYLAPTSN